MGNTPKVDLTDVTIELLNEGGQHEPALTELAELINSVYRVAESDLWIDGYQRTDVETLKELIGNSEIIAAKLGGKTIACVHISSLGGVVFKFGMLSVPPKYEGKGIGGRLVEAAEVHALSLGANKMRLELLTPGEGQHKGKLALQEWYIRLGYVFVKERPFEKVAPNEAPNLRMSCFFDIYEKPLRIDH